jgi:hypothetical protein
MLCRLDAAVPALSKLLTLGQDSCPYSLVMLTMHGRVKQSYVPSKQQLRRQRRISQQQQQQQERENCPDVDMTDAAALSDQLPAGPGSTGGAAAAAAAGDDGERLWGCHPRFFRGWGEEESSRVTNTRLRRVLLLHLRVSCSVLLSSSCNDLLSLGG